MFQSKPSTSWHEKNLDRAGAFDDLKKIKKIRSKYIGLSVTFFIVGLLLIFPIHILLFGGTEFGLRLSFVGAYFGDLIKMLTPGNPVTTSAWLQNYIGWYFVNAFQGFMALAQQGNEAGITAWKSGIVIGSWIVSFVTPYMIIKAKIDGLDTTPNIFGDTRWADEHDIQEMSKKDLVGFDGSLFLVGKLKNKFIQMKETLSVLLLAPPGTGKTVAFIVPSTVMMDKSCQLLNDQKPELFFMTSGHRSTLGPVFQIQWSAQDMPEGGWMTEEQVSLISPELVEKDEKDEMVRNASGDIKVRPIFYPSWNPIGPSSIPSAGPKRDLYIERLASVLAPDPNGGDKFWTSKARAALIGLVHYLVAKVEMGQSDLFPNQTEDGIPKHWKGQECSFPMFIDWFTEAQGTVEDFESDDPIRELFRNALQDARVMDEAYSGKYGIAILNRAITELTNLMNAPDKTRGSILTTLDEALSPFKNEAARQRTCASSFSFNELRGRPKKEPHTREMKKKKELESRGEIYHPRYRKDEWDPITIYISINAEDAKAFATITGIFIDSANAYLVANGPNSIDDRGNQLGPNDFFFLLDETPTLPKLDTVINGPAVGRSKRVSYAIVGQDFAQIETRYSKPEVETMKSTTAMKVVLSQNNEAAARAVTEMAGSMTYMKASYGKKDYGDPVTKFLDMKKEIITGTNWEKRNFLDTSFIMSMPTDKHIVLVQNFMSRPILADTPKFFMEPELLPRVYNLRTGEGPKPALPMPKDMMDDAAVIGAETKKIKEEKIAISQAQSNSFVAIVVSPQNISDISRDLDLAQYEPVNSNAVGTEFAICHVEIDEDTEFFDLPEGDQITTTSDPNQIYELLEGRKVFVFGPEDKAAIQEFLPAGKEIADDLWIQAKETILHIDDEEDGDIFTAGYQGTVNCDLPMSPDAVTPGFALRWLCEIITVLQAFNEEKKRIEMGM
jgi:type IV secretory pathway TraG/TraD family ATPase VirD4